MIKIESTITNSVKSLMLNSEDCPVDGAYKVLASNDPDEPKVVLVVDEDIIFSDGFALKEIVKFQHLEHSYSIESCVCNISFTD